MQKKKKYTRTFFPAEVIRAVEVELSKRASEANAKFDRPTYDVSFERESWSYENLDEFLADYRRDPMYVTYNRSFRGTSVWLMWQKDLGQSDVIIAAVDRGAIESLFHVFEAAVNSARLPDPPKPEEPRTRPVVFIGHGRSQLWRQLKDHLQDKHKVQIEAYESGARAGHAIRDILEHMLDRSSFALLVLTGEDETAEGDMRARQNVIHETGLFQGRLGFSRAIVVKEDGTEEFSNIHGIEQIRFSKGNIKETFGEVLSVLRREFPDCLAE